MSNKLTQVDLGSFDDTPLEETLFALSRYGKPRVGHDGHGWFCVVETFVNAIGVNFEVRSDFSMISPLAAARQCATRLNAALKQLKT